LQNGGGALIPFADIENVTMASFACIESLMVGGWIKINRVGYSKGKAYG